MESTGLVLSVDLYVWEEHSSCVPASRLLSLPFSSVSLHWTQPSASRSLSFCDRCRVLTAVCVRAVLSRDGQDQAQEAGPREEEGALLFPKCFLAVRFLPFSCSVRCPHRHRPLPSGHDHSLDRALSSGQEYKRKHDTKRRGRDLDQIQDDIRNAEASGKSVEFSFDDDLPGYPLLLGLLFCRIISRWSIPRLGTLPMAPSNCCYHGPGLCEKLVKFFALAVRSGGGQFYCVETGKHFVSLDALSKHKKSRFYRRRCVPCDPVVSC